MWPAAPEPDGPEPDSASGPGRCRPKVPSPGVVAPPKGTPIRPVFAAMTGRGLERPDLVVVVADLHLGAGHSNGHAAGVDRSFASFVDWLVERADRERRHIRLVILGDFLDLAPNSSPKAIADVRHVTFDALRRLLASGGALQIVVGNHDLALADPAVGREVLELLGEPKREGCAAIHPWQIHIPGLLYAEHGHQYHAPNATVTPLDPFVPGLHRRLELPLGPYLQQLADPTGRSTERWRRRIGAIVAGIRVVASRRLAHSRRETYRRTLLVAHAAKVSLPVPALVAIDRLAALSETDLLVRLVPRHSAGPLVRWLAAGGAAAATAVVARRPGIRMVGSAVALFAVASIARSGRRLTRVRPRSSDYLEAAASDIHQILDSAGCGVPLVVFGHSHLAEVVDLTGARTRWFLNPGAWSGWSMRGAGSPLDDGSSPAASVGDTFLEIERLDAAESGDASTAIAARLAVWDAASRSSTLLDGVGTVMVPPPPML